MTVPARGACRRAADSHRVDHDTPHRRPAAVRANLAKAAAQTQIHRDNTGSRIGTMNAVSTPFSPMPSPANAPVSSPI